MPEPIELELGDPCPACGGELVAARVPTPEEYRRATDKENPVALPAGADTASPDQRAELGALHRCGACGYQARFHTDAGDTADEGADEAGASASAGARKRARSAGSRRGSR